ncbi:MAG: hypothetical protein J7474_11865, partial [Arthrobacter sp.]|nr:hypothetical protein [Arthrobacter sp.]
MPHALVREADGTFTFAPFSWKPRRVGDTQTNPPPPFIGRRLRDVFFYKNRLGYLVDETVVFSVAGDYGDFWRRTVLDYIDSDVLAVTATTTDVSVLDYAVPFNDGIMLFSAQRQFSLSNGESGLSASSVEVSPVTAFSTSPNVRPVPLGTQVYFASDSGGSVSIQEYTRLDGVDATDAAEVTAHVPGLIKPGVSKLIAIPDYNAVVVLRALAEDRNIAYVYQFFWDGQKKVVSAWRPWDFGSGKIISGTFFSGDLYLLMRRGDDFFLERMNLQPEAKSADQDHLIYLDRGVSITGTYDALADHTTFTLPYSPDPDLFRLLQTKNADYPENMVPATKYTLVDDTVTIPGDVSATPLTAGEVFTTRFVFSRQFPQDYQLRPLTTGRLQIHTFSVTYTASAYFEAHVQPYGADAVGSTDELTQVVPFNGRLIGTASYRLGNLPYRSGTFTFPVAGDASLAYIA